jgi:hypothetical protein
MWEILRSECRIGVDSLRRDRVRTSPEGVKTLQEWGIPQTGDSVSDSRLEAVLDVELSPEESDEVVAAIAAALAAPTPAADPWWQAGLEESLAT